MSRSLTHRRCRRRVDMQEYYRTILPVLGHVVVAVAETGRELVEKCRDQRPDLVITDIKMPDMDGIDAAARDLPGRAGPRDPRLGLPRPEFIERAEREHVLAYLVKPIKQADLEAGDRDRRCGGPSSSRHYNGRRPT